MSTLGRRGFPERKRSEEATLGTYDGRNDDRGIDIGGGEKKNASVRPAIKHGPSFLFGNRQSELLGSKKYGPHLGSFLKKTTKRQSTLKHETKEKKAAKPAQLQVVNSHPSTTAH